MASRVTEWGLLIMLGTTRENTMNEPKRTPCYSAILLTGLALLTGAQAQEARIDIQADRVVHPLSRFLTGACLEDVNHEVYGGIYSQMVFGESFQEPAPAPSIEGFRAYGGPWVLRDGVLRINGLDGPKLVSDCTRVQGWRSGRRRALGRPAG